MRNILVTGGAGFIGSHLCDRLLGEGNTVIAVDNLYQGRISNLKKAKENKIDFVYHLAANSDIAKSHKDPSIDLKLTYLTTYYTLEAMRQFNIKKIMFASTSAIYGQTGGKEVTENYGPLFPASHYGACKLASEGLISSYCENYGMIAYITRFPNVCGERTTHGILHDFIKKLKQNPNRLQVLGNGQQEKPYLYVEELIDAIEFIIAKCNKQINYFNIGVEDTTKVSDIAQMVINAMKLDARIEYTGGDRGWIGDVPKFRYSLKKIHNLGWKAKLSSNDAVEKSIELVLKEDLCNL